MSTSHKVPGQDLAAPFPIQLLVNTFAKAEEDSPHGWAPPTQAGNAAEVPASWLRPSPAQTPLSFRE